MKNRFTNLRRGLALTTLLAAGSLATRAQNVGIGTTAPNASAALDIVSTTKGVLLPRVADCTALASPATGLIVFQTGGTAGYYYNAGTPGTPNWQQLATASGAAVTASNGLTKTGQNIALGGTLTGATTIAQGGNNFSLTGGNVGLGTTTPTLNLDVVGSSIGLRNSAAWDHLYLLHDGSTAAVRAGGAETGLSLQVGSSATGTYGDASQNYRDVMRLLPNGNVGIGTATPAYPLDVNGSIHAVTSQGVVLDGQDRPLITRGWDAFTSGAYSGVGRWGVFMEPNNLTFGVPALGGKQFQWVTYNASSGISTTPMTLTQGGNLGIGTTVPTARLHARGTANAYPATTGTAQSAGLISRFQTSDNAILDLGGNSGNGFWLQSTDITTLALNYPLLLNPNGGNVGFGTTAPSALLDVNGSTRLRGLTTAGLVTTDASGNLGSASTASFGTSFIQNQNAADQTANFRIAGTGSVGSLQAVGATAAVQTIGTQGGYLQWNRSGSDGETWLLNQQGLGTSNAGIRFGGATTANVVTEWARFLNNGNFGIGTTAPAQKLDVVGNIQASANMAVDYTNANAGTVANTLRFGPVSSGEAIGSKRTAGGNQFGLDFYTTSTARLSINSAGNVGIGTTTPGYPLQVVGGAVSSGTNAYLGFFDRNDATKLYNWYAAGRATLNLTTTTGGNVDLFTVTNAGNVGVGTTAPSTQLSNTTSNILGNDGNGISTQSRGWVTTTNGYAAAFASAAGDGVGHNNRLAVKVSGTSGTALDISTGALNATGTSLLRVTGTGNVGIGTNAPVAGLHIDRPQLATNTGLGVILSGGTSGNPSIELRGNGDTPFVDFVETTGADFSTRLISQAGTLNVNNASAAVPALNVNGYTKLTGPAAVTGATVPGVATALFTGNLPTADNTNVGVSLGGIATSRILSVSIMALSPNGNYFPPNQSTAIGFGSGYEYGYYLETSSNTLRLAVGTNAANVKNTAAGAVKILVTYQQ